ncbi:hypothetical protein L596_029877 [Steinernema carpocapsae]|uniref:SXP/RAL-2 family protein Ani s 5-like cation-binding domain-containing protein n=1 Tax=Steinernema carpocapsae TaxID=34508 RepID=A0A4U5LR35_STECR|nr:hypothetical protein L596_029877 [Steinernema carpocapsae]
MSRLLLACVWMLFVLDFVKCLREPLNAEILSFKKLLNAEEVEKLGNLENKSYNEAFQAIFDIVKTKNEKTKNMFIGIQEQVEQEKADKAIDLEVLAWDMKPLLSKKGKKNLVEMMEVFNNRKLRPSDIQMQLQGLFETMDENDKRVVNQFYQENLMF